MNRISISIRRVNESDSLAIFEFVCLLEETEFEYDVFHKAYLKNMGHEDNIYLMAETEGIPIAFISCHTQLLLHHGGLKIGEIQEMYVQPVFRNMGVGKLLIERLKAEAQEKNILQLEVTSNKKRIDSHRFYLQAGFENTHEKFVFYKRE